MSSSDGDSSDGHEFTCRWGASTVVFGRGAREQLGELLVDLPRPFGLVASPSQVRTGAAEQVRRVLGGDLAGNFEETVVHAPRETCDAAGRALADCASLVVVGGGAALSVAKVVAVEQGQPMVALPTTFSGSEMTGLFGITVEGEKRVSWDALALPRVVVYDPELVMSLPIDAAHASAVNCLAHAVEAAWSPASSPLARPVAHRCASALGRGLAAADGDGGLEAAADQLVLAGWLGGITLTVGAMGVHHAVCHVLGGRYGVSHGLLNAIVLPAAMRFNAATTASVQEDMVSALRREGEGRLEPWQVLDRRLDGWKLPRRLSDIGLELADVDAMSSEVAASGAAATNPVPVQGRTVAMLLEEIR